MDTVQPPSSPGDDVVGRLTPEKVRRARAQVAAIHEQMRQRGVDLAHLPDPVEELIKAREAGYRDDDVDH